MKVALQDTVPRDALLSNSGAGKAVNDVSLEIHQDTIFDSNILFYSSIADINFALVIYLSVYIILGFIVLHDIILLPVLCFVFLSSHHVYVCDFLLIILIYFIILPHISLFNISKVFSS